MRTHGLDDWRLAFDHARQRCGACHFSARTITLSRHFVHLNDPQELRDTVLHEIAHALAGPHSGHGPRWQQIAEHIGAPVQTTNNTASMPAPRWGLQCESCSQIVARRHRRRINLHLVRCGHCGVHHGQLNWVEMRGNSTAQ